MSKNKDEAMREMEEELAKLIEEGLVEKAIDPVTLEEGYKITDKGIKEYQFLIDLYNGKLN